MGALGWPEAVFWATSLHGYSRARTGYAKANGHVSANTVSNSDVKQLKALMAEHPATLH